MQQMQSPEELQGSLSLYIPTSQFQVSSSLMRKDRVPWNKVCDNVTEGCTMHAHAVQMTLACHQIVHEFSPLKPPESSLNAGLSLCIYPLVFIKRWQPQSQKSAIGMCLIRVLLAPLHGCLHVSYLLIAACVFSSDEPLQKQEMCTLPMGFTSACSQQRLVIIAVSISPKPRAKGALTLSDHFPKFTFSFLSLPNPPCLPLCPHPRFSLSLVLWHIPLLLSNSSFQFLSLSFQVSTSSES